MTVRTAPGEILGPLHEHVPRQLPRRLLGTGKDLRRDLPLGQGLTPVVASRCATHTGESHSSLARAASGPCRSQTRSLPMNHPDSVLGGGPRTAITPSHRDLGSISICRIWSAVVGRVFGWFEGDSAVGVQGEGLAGEVDVGVVVIAQQDQVA